MQNSNGFVFKLKRQQQRQSIRKSLKQQNRTPHPKIHPRDYINLIDPQLSDPQRLRQLLLWCCSSSKPTKESNLDPIVKKVQEMIMQGLRSKQLNTSWYHKSEPENPQEEHPQNIENRQKLAQFSNLLQRYQQEISTFESLESTNNLVYSDLMNAYEKNQQIAFDLTDIYPFLDQNVKDLLDKPIPDVKEWIDGINDAILIDCHSLIDIFHNCRSQVQDMNHSFEELYAKMLRAWQEKRNDVDPKMVLTKLQK